VAREIVVLDKNPKRARAVAMDIAPLASVVDIRDGHYRILAARSSWLRRAIEHDVRYANIAIIEGNQASQFGIGIVSARIVEAVLRDERIVIPVGSYNPTYGAPLSMPSVVGRAGVLRILEPSMSEEERLALERSSDAAARADDGCRAWNSSISYSASTKWNVSGRVFAVGPLGLARRLARWSAGRRDCVVGACSHRSRPSWTPVCRLPLTRRQLTALFFIGCLDSECARIGRKSGDLPIDFGRQAARRRLTGTWPGRRIEHL